MIIAELKAALSLETILTEVGVELRGNKALCPFHDDKNPSFSVKNGRWRCWAGCGGGDIIDFTAKYYGLDIKGAIRHLAVKAGIKPGKPDPARDLECKRKKALLDDFRRWERERVDELATLIKASYEVMEEIGPEKRAVLQGELDYIEYLHNDILCGPPEERLDLYLQEATAHERI